MYFYKIGYWGYENGDETVLIHKDRFSEGELRNIQIKIMRKLLKELADSGVDDDILNPYFEGKVFYYRVYDRIIRRMVKEFGFKEMKYEAKVISEEYENVIDIADKETKKKIIKILEEKKKIYDEEDKKLMEKNNL